MSIVDKSRPTLANPDLCGNCGNPLRYHRPWIDDNKDCPVVFTTKFKGGAVGIATLLVFLLLGAIGGACGRSWGWMGVAWFAAAFVIVMLAGAVHVLANGDK